MKILSGILILVTVYLNIKHGWAGISGRIGEAEAKMFADLGIVGPTVKVVGILSFAVAVLVLFPRTFFVGNLLNAALILVIMALALRVGSIKTALIEIPFLLMPLVMIWLGHPLKK